MLTSLFDFRGILRGLTCTRNPMRTDESMSRTCFSCFPMLTCTGRPCVRAGLAQTYAGSEPRLKDNLCEGQGNKRTYTCCQMDLCE